MEPDVGVRSPAIASASSRCPLPETPAMPTISPARTSRSSPRTASVPRSPRTCRSCTASRTSPIAGMGDGSCDGSSWPTIISASSLRVTFAGRTVPTFRPARSTVMRSESSRTSRILCEMKTRPRPSSTIWRRTREEVVDLARRQHRGRLVEDEQRGVAIERLDDLDALALADGELPDDRGRVDVEPVAGGELADPLRHRAEIGERPPSSSGGRGRRSPPPSACSRA